jgi:hypothetical protein
MFARAAERSCSPSEEKGLLGTRASGVESDQGTPVAVLRRVVRAASLAGEVGGIRLRIAGNYVVEMVQEFETETLERLLSVLAKEQLGQRRSGDHHSPSTIGLGIGSW